MKVYQVLHQVLLEEVVWTILPHVSPKSPSIFPPDGGRLPEQVEATDGKESDGHPELELLLGHLRRVVEESDEDCLQNGVHKLEQKHREQLNRRLQVLRQLNSFILMLVV
jgi:hypothetical protein